MFRRHHGCSSGPTREWLVRALALLVVLASLVPGGVASARPGPVPGPDDLILPPTAAELEAQMERLALRTDLDEATRTRMAASFASAAEQIRAAVEWAEQAAEFDRFIAEAPAQHRQLEQELA